MTKASMLVAALAASAIIAAAAAGFGGNNKLTGNETSAKVDAGISAAEFSASFSSTGTKIFEKLGKSGGNIAISPYSIGMAMDMTYCGARGETAEEMAKALSLPEGASPEKVMNGAGEMAKSLKSGKSLTIETAFSIWTRRKINEKYASDCKRSFDAETSDRLSKEAINNWVSQKTHKKISRIIDTDAGLEMAIVNAVYFNGSWKSQFDKGLTRKADFTKTDGSRIKVDMMSQSVEIPYYEDDEFQMVSLPYNGGVSMQIVLPQRGGKAKPSPETAARLKSKASWEEVNLKLPKFKAEYRTSLKDALISLGMERAFSDEADFSGITQGLKISDVIHSAVVDVNENGTEAAAATAVVMEDTCVDPEYAPKPKYFTANRPFLFVISDDRNGIPLFAGYVEEPEYK